MNDHEALIAAARRYAGEHGGLPGQEAWGVWAAQERAAGRAAPSFKVVRRLFRNMAGLAEAAGVAYRPAPPRRAKRVRVQGMGRQQYIDTHLARLLDVAAHR